MPGFAFSLIEKMNILIYIANNHIYNKLFSFVCVKTIPWPSGNLLRTGWPNLLWVPSDKKVYRHYSTFSTAKGS